MSELRLHDAGVQVTEIPPQLRLHDAGVTVLPEPTARELRIHQCGLTIGIPPVGDGGWYVRVNGQWVKHRMYVRLNGQWV